MSDSLSLTSTDGGGGVTGMIDSVGGVNIQNGHMTDESPGNYEHETMETSPITTSSTIDNVVAKAVANVNSNYSNPDIPGAGHLDGVTVVANPPEQVTVK